MLSPDQKAILLKMRHYICNAEYNWHINEEVQALQREMNLQQEGNAISQAPTLSSRVTTGKP